jgi:hypothetical protein
LFRYSAPTATRNRVVAGAELYAYQAAGL